MSVCVLPVYERQYHGESHDGVPTPGGPWISATSLDASANSIASFCESFRLGSIHSGVEVGPVDTGVGDDNPNRTWTILDISPSDSFESLVMVWFIL